MNSHGSNGNPKVLVVGNHPAVIVSLRTILSLNEMDVVATSEAEGAIGYVEEPGPEIRLALVDVRTVAMEPRALAERLRAAQPNLKVLFFSSLVDGEVIRLGIIDPDRNVLRTEGVVAAVEEALGLAAPLKVMTA
jgi:DNA-binding NarL/FixJ family response regulator